MHRVVLFVDLDYFFAQVEEVENPSLRERPVAVCVFSGRTEDSGVVSSANYLARKLGVKAGMPIKAAKRLLPGNATIIPARLSFYMEKSRKIMDILRSFGGVLRVESVDEAVIDATEIVNRDYAKAVQLAEALKKRVHEETGLTCSVGIGPNKVVAKMAADSCKPNGLKAVFPDEVPSFLANLPVKDLPGIGAKAESLLAEYGVKTLSDLAKLELDFLEKLFGSKKARYLYLASRGLFDEAITEKQPPKQISKIITLKQNTRDLEEIMQALERVVEETNVKLESSGYFASRVGLIAITSTIKTVTRQAEIKPGARADELLRVLEKMVKELLEKDEKLLIRRIGVRFSDLQQATGQTRLNVFVGE
ncbi:MAG: DNA polymerase IV [Candidatus Caldarchaeum sp.]